MAISSYLTPLHKIVNNDQSLGIVITNNLFGYPLYAFWIIVIDLYDPDDIEGMLTDDITKGAFGPFRSVGDAEQWLTKELTIA